MFAPFEKYLAGDTLLDSKDCCVHEFFTNLDGLTCIRCQFQKPVETSETNGISQKRQVLIPGILKELEFLNLGENVIDIANKYFLQVCGLKVYRGNKRKGIIAACIYHAYLKVGEFENFETIAKKFGLSYRKAADGFKLVKIKIAETRNSVESMSDVAKGIMRQLQLKICPKFEAFLQSNTFNSQIKLCKRTKLVIAGLIFRFIQQEYKSTVKVSDFCEKLNLCSTELEKLLEHEFRNLLTQV
jgi:hypothetical protein